MLVIVASLTGGQALRAIVAAVIFFVIATAWTWWGFRKRIRARDEAAAAEAAGGQAGRGRAGARTAPANGQRAKEAG